MAKCALKELTMELHREDLHALLIIGTLRYLLGTLLMLNPNALATLFCSFKEELKKNTFDFASFICLPMEEAKVDKMYFMFYTLGILASPKIMLSSTNWRWVKASIPLITMMPFLLLLIMQKVM